MLNLNNFKMPLKITTACFLAFVTYKAIRAPHGQWLVISALSVLMSEKHIGGMLRKSWLRLLGTLLGALVGVVTLLAVGHNELVFIIVMLVASFSFMYILVVVNVPSYIGFLGLATISIILFSPEPELIVAGERLTEILLGILIALVVNYLVFPFHASKHFKTNLSKYFRQLSTLYKSVFLSDVSGELFNQHQAHEACVIKTLSYSEKLLKDALIESKSMRGQRVSYFAMITAQRKCFRAVCTMINAAIVSRDVYHALKAIKNISVFNACLVQILDELSISINTEQALRQIDPMLSILKLLHQEIKQLAEQKSQQEQVLLHAFLFGAEQFVQEISHFVQLLDNERTRS